MLVNEKSSHQRAGGAIFVLGRMRRAAISTLLDDFAVQQFAGSGSGRFIGDTPSLSVAVGSALGGDTILKPWKQEPTANTSSRTLAHGLSAEALLILHCS